MPSARKDTEILIDLMQRRLHDANERSAKGETDNHRRDQSDRHFHDRPPQVFEMFEKGLGGFAFRQLAKLEDIAQRHFTGAATG